ncbi:hypothetical protein [Aliidiomarina soli]|nr:hypothetical protein [Aliidiomarina soli]
MNVRAMQVVAGALLLGLAVGCSPQTEMTVQQQIEQRLQLNERRYDALRQLDDQELARLLWEAEQQNYYWALETLAFDSKPYEIEYAQPRMHRLGDYASIESMTDAYLGSLLVSTQSSSRACFRSSNGQGLSLHEGFSLPLAHRLRLQSVQLESGELLQVADEDSSQQETADIIRMRDGYCFTKPREENAPRAVSATAEFYAQLPQDVIELELTAANIGQPVEQNGYVVTLLELNNYSYAIEIESTDGEPTGLREDEVIGEAITASGQYIQRRVTGRQRGDRQPRMSELLGQLISKAADGELSVKDAQAELETFNQSIEQNEGASLYNAYAFHGPVETAKVTLLAGEHQRREVKQTIELPVYSFTSPSAAEQVNLTSLPQLPLTPPVYNHRKEVRAEYSDLDAAAMSQQIEIRQRRISQASDPSITYPAQVFFHYPVVQSDLFIPIFERYNKPNAGDVHFFAASGERVEVVEADDDGADSLPFSFMVSRIEYDPARFAVTPTRLKATIPVLTAPGIVKDSYQKDQLPAGLSLNGNQLIIDYAEFTPREVADMNERMVERRNQVFTRDEHGYLAEIATLTLPRRDGEPVDVYYFHGEPNTVEIWYRGETETVPFTVDIELAQPD